MLCRLVEVNEGIPFLRYVKPSTRPLEHCLERTIDPLIHLKTDLEIDAMKASGSLAAETLKMVESHINPGVTTQELDDICHQFIVDGGGIPAPLNYRGFPRSICTSVNEVVCHGIPSAKHSLKDGDIINVDVTAIVDGFHGDTSKTFYVGNRQSKVSKRLTECARDCLYLGIAQVKEGARIGDIGAAIVNRAKKDGFSVVREFVGHGIGTNFHEDPQIPHYGESGKGKRLTPGMVFTIEPMINEGHWKTKILKDGWTAITIDRGFSAQFEHTLAIRSDGRVEVLTLHPDDRGLLV